jgi:hypothetical protein
LVIIEKNFAVGEKITAIASRYVKKIIGNFEFFRTVPIDYKYMYIYMWSLKLKGLSHQIRYA